MLTLSKIVAFGDSITAGEGIPVGADKWTDIIKNRFNLELINSGVSGNTSTQGLERIEKDVLIHNPDIVLINFGMNDKSMEERNKAKVDIRTFEENILTMIYKIRNIRAIPILITTNYIIEGNENGYYYSRHDNDYYTEVGGAEIWLDKYIQKVREIAEAQKVDLIDVRRECEIHDRYKFLRSLENDSYADGVHPHTYGVLVYAKVIGDYLDEKYI